MHNNATSHPLSAYSGMEVSHLLYAVPIDALQSLQASALHASPQMANNLEGGGRTPLLSPEELEELGFKLVAYPLSLLGVSMRAMQSALQLLKACFAFPSFHNPLSNRCLACRVLAKPCLRRQFAAVGILESLQLKGCLSVVDAGVPLL